MIDGIFMDLSPFPSLETWHSSTHSIEPTQLGDYRSKRKLWPSIARAGTGDLVMKSDNSVKIIEMCRTADNVTVRCRVHAYDNGSVYVDGDEVEIAGDESPETLQEILEYLESLGYARTQ